MKCGCVGPRHDRLEEVNDSNCRIEALERINVELAELLEAALTVGRLKSPTGGLHPNALHRIEALLNRVKQ